MASSGEISKISMEHNQESTCIDAETSPAKGKLHNGDATKSISDPVGQNSYVNTEGSTTSNHTDNMPCSDKKRETRVKRRERSKEESATDKKPSTKELTELDKYWKVVEDNPSDFTGWTYLLQYVEQEKNTATVHKAFDAFLAHYPYCYGYWKKYADLEKEPDKTEEVFEQGVKAVALSIDLWIHYLTFALNKYATHADKVSIIRGLFERAMAAAGLDFRSDKLWEMYLKWEKENGDLHRVTALYDRLLTTPTQLYRHHFDCFKEFVNSHHPKDILDVDEFLRLRNQVFANKSTLHANVTADDDDTDSPPAGVEGPPPGLEVPPGEEPAPGTAGTTSKGDDAEVAPLREKIIELRSAMFDALQTEVSKRWTFEETVRRPYFHVKPLEKSQLKNWRDYLDFEISCGSHDRIVVLFERCVITCALYEEFWLKYAKYQEPQGIEAIRHVLQRACHIHLPKKPHLHFTWAAYEERHGQFAEAADVLHVLEKNMNGLAMVSLRCISLERRQGNFSRVDELYKDYIGKAESSEVRSFYAIKYARYLAKVIGNIDAAKTILEDALDSDQSNHKLYLQLVDVEYQKSTVDEQAMLKLFGRAIDGPLPTEHRVAFSQRRLEFLEDFGSNVTRILDAYEEHQKILKELQSTKKRKMSESQESADKKNRTEMTPEVASSNYAQPPPVMQSYGDMSAAYNYSQHWGAYANPTGYGYQHPGWGGYAQQYYGAQ